MRGAMPWEDLSGQTMYRSSWHLNQHREEGSRACGHGGEGPEGLQGGSTKGFGILSSILADVLTALPPRGIIPSQGVPSLFKRLGQYEAAQVSGQNTWQTTSHMA
jgi:hypothetical protein